MGALRGMQDGSWRACPDSRLRGNDVMGRGNDVMGYGVRRDGHGTGDSRLRGNDGRGDGGWGNAKAQGRNEKREGWGIWVLPYG